MFSTRIVELGMGGNSTTAARTPVGDKAKRSSFRWRFSGLLFLIPEQSIRD